MSRFLVHESVKGEPIYLNADKVTLIQTVGAPGKVTLHCMVGSQSLNVNGMTVAVGRDLAEQIMQFCSGGPSSMKMGHMLFDINKARKELEAQVQQGELKEADGDPED